MEVNFWKPLIALGRPVGDWYKRLFWNDYIAIRLAARILAMKLLEGEGWKEGDRLKEIQEKVKIICLLDIAIHVSSYWRRPKRAWIQDKNELVKPRIQKDNTEWFEPQVGVEVGQMVGKVDSVLHQEDFTLQEVGRVPLTMCLKSNLIETAPNFTKPNEP